MDKVLTQFIKQSAAEIGFDACGIAKADYLAEDTEFMKTWLQKGFHGEMNYLERNFEKRVDPRLMVEGCRSVIVVLMNYFPEQKQPETAPKIAKYAFSRMDYHAVLKSKLLQLESVIIENFGAQCFNAGQQHRFVDSSPVLERRWAERAGLGWIGRNKMLINPNLGSFVFIGILLINKELEYDEPGKNRCGSCRRCLDACPTKALTENDGFNANLCISYQTIEKKGVISPEIRGKLSGYAYGCDICNNVCPWNIKKSKSHRHSEFEPVEEILLWGEQEWSRFSEADYRRMFHSSAINRAGYNKLKENLEYVKTNHA